jgi:hypothetical protein
VILPPDYERRTVDTVRRILDDIPECATAQISVVFEGQEPRLRMVFGDPNSFSRPMLKVGLLAQSRQNPLGPGRLITDAQIQRHVREWVEEYFKLQGTPITQKVS